MCCWIGQHGVLLSPVPLSSTLAAGAGRGQGHSRVYSCASRHRGSPCATPLCSWGLGGRSQAPPSSTVAASCCLGCLLPEHVGLIRGHIFYLLRSGLVPVVLEGKVFLSLQMERWSVSTSPRLLRGAQRDLGHLQPHRDSGGSRGAARSKAQELLALATLQFCTNTIFQIRSPWKRPGPSARPGWLQVMEPPP